MKSSLDMSFVIENIVQLSHIDHLFALLALVKVGVSRPRLNAEISGIHRQELHSAVPVEKR